MIQKLGVWQGGCTVFLSKESGPLCEHKARVKTINSLHRQRRQKPIFDSFSVYFQDRLNKEKLDIRICFIRK
jgi:hypothetical protein